MAKLKLNKTLARSITIIGTVVVGLSIWLTISHTPQISSSGAPAVVQDPNFSTSDTFLTQPNVKTGSVVPQVQPGITSQASPAQPTTAQAPVNSAPVYTPTPRFRTRGS